MGNRRAREYTKQAQVRADWDRLKTQKRSFFADAGAFGSGIRRLKVIYSPSFGQGYAWEITELEDRLSLYRSRVCAEDSTLVGYDLLAFDSKELRQYLSRIRNIEIALHPTGGAGLDGKMIHLGIYSRGWSAIHLSWWANAQDDWKPIERVTHEMIKRFSEAVPDTATQAEQDGASNGG